MALLKIPIDLKLEKLELDRYRDFLDTLGFRKFIVEEAFSFGLFQKEKNGYVEIDTNNQQGDRCIKINEVKAVDSNGNFIYLPTTLNLPITISNVWYWVKISHKFSNFEEGLFSIDSYGNLSGVGSKLTEIIRVLPNSPTKVAFESKDGLPIYNNLEYEFIELVDDSTARLNGNSFYPESGLKLKIIGTSTPGIRLKESDKFIFNYDSCEYSFEPEEEQNTPPAKVPGLEFYLCRVKLLDGELIIQDKRSEFFSKIKQNSQVSFFNPVVGVESIKWTKSGENLVQLGWGLLVDNFSIDSSRNVVALSSILESGKYKSINDSIGSEFTGWRLYTEQGDFFNIISSSRQGSSINLNISYLDISKFSEDGGMTIKSQRLYICPPFDFIQIEFTDSLGSVTVVTQAINPVQTSIILPIVSRGSSYYRIRTKYFSSNYHSSYQQITSDIKNGFLSEDSFNTDGVLTSIIRKKYTSSSDSFYIELRESPNSLFNFKDSLQKSFDGIEQLQFSNKSIVETIKLKESKKFQLLSKNSFSGSQDPKLFINLSLEGLINGGSFTFLLSPDCIIGSKEIYIVIDYIDTTNTGTVLKRISVRDQKYASSIGSNISFEVVTDGYTWYLSQNYYLGIKGEIITIQGNKTDNFDSTGLGKFDLLGYALCNGQNGTPDLQTDFVLQNSSQTEYKKLLIQKIF